MHSQAYMRDRYLELCIDVDYYVSMNKTNYPKTSYAYSIVTGQQQHYYTITTTRHHYTTIKAPPHHHHAVTRPDNATKQKPSQY